MQDASPFVYGHDEAAYLLDIQREEKKEAGR